MTTLLASPHTTGGASGEVFLDDLTEAQRAVYRRIPEKVDYVYDPSFDSPSAADEWFGEQAEQVEVAAWTHFPEVADEVSSRPAARAALSARDEARLFLQYNYARYRLAALIEVQGRRRSAVRARQMVLWYQRVMDLQAKLVGANMALVLAMAKRTRIRGVEFPELISEGNMALLRSVEKFDVSRGFKFSTYACRAILKGFHRLATNTGRYRQHFPTEFDPKLERSDYDVQKHDIQRDDSVEALRDILARNRASLTDVERTVVMERFAIGTGGKGRTLSEVGKMVGLTNERVRQIQNTALAKLRAVLDEDYLAA
jgi:RNA polymerase primary sigma factor